MLPGMDGIEVCAAIRAESRRPDHHAHREGRHDGCRAGPRERRRRLRRQAVQPQGAGRAHPHPPAPDAARASGDTLAHRRPRARRRRATRCAAATSASTSPRSSSSCCSRSPLKPQQVFTREMLLEQVWGYHYKADTRLVNVHVQRLRAKVEHDPDNPRIVMTVRGVGYRAGAARSSAAPCGDWPDWRGWLRPPAHGSGAARCSSAPSRSRSCSRRSPSRVIGVVHVDQRRRQPVRAAARRRCRRVEHARPAVAQQRLRRTPQDVGDQAIGARRRQRDRCQPASGRRRRSPADRDPARARPERPDRRSTTGRATSFDGCHLSTSCARSVQRRRRETRVLAVGRDRRSVDGQTRSRHRRRLAARRADGRRLRAVPRLRPQRRRSRPSTSCSSTLVLGGLALVAAHRRRHLLRRAARRRPGADRGRDQREARGRPARGAHPGAGRRRASRPSRARSTAWPTACSGRSRSSPTSRACSSASSRTSRTSCARRSPPSGSPATCSTTSATTFPPATARTAELLHTQVERFEVLLADLLEISRYDAGAVALEIEPTNLVRLVEDADRGDDAARRGEAAPSCAWSRPAATSRPRSTRAASAASCRTCSATRSSTARASPIVVYVDSNASAVAIAVRDYGVGMTPADMERVFDRFWRADPSRQRTIGGTGLGLAISLEDAALHGGWLEVWSEPGEGSCFRLTLPRRRGEQVDGFAARAAARRLPADECRRGGAAR